MTKQLIDLVLENIAGELTQSEYKQVKEALTEYDDLVRDNLELQEQLSKYENI